MKLRPFSPPGFFRQGAFPYAPTAVALSFLLLPLVLFFGLDVSGICKNLYSPDDNLYLNFPLEMFSRHLDLWNDLIRIGHPMFADPEAHSFYPISLLLMNLLKPPLSMNCFVLIHYTLAGFFTFLFLRELGLTRFSSWWGSVVFMFCGFFVGHKEHVQNIDAGVWLPLILFSMEKKQKTSKPGYLFLGTLGVAMSILGGYPQVTMFLAFVMLAYALRCAISPPVGTSRWGMSVSALLMLLFGSLLSAIQLVPTFEALGISTRESITYGYFTDYSFNYQYFPMVIFPYIYGGGYSGSDLAFRSSRVSLRELTGYVGILPLLMAILAVVICWKRNKQVTFWFLVAAASFVLVLGDSLPFYQWIYRIPVFNLFRGPARNWYECDFSLAVLSAFGMERFLRDEPEASQKVRRLTAILAGGCLLTIALSAYFFRVIRNLPLGHSFFRLVSVNSSQLLAKNLELGSPAVYVPMLLLAASACLLLVVPRLRKGIPLFAALIVFLCLDLLSFGYYHDRFFIPYAEMAQGTDPISFLKGQPDPDSFRIFCTSDVQFRTLLSPNTAMLYGIRTVNGFEDVLLTDYYDLTGFNYHGVATPARQRFLLLDNRLLSLMSTEFIATQDKNLASLLESATRLGLPTYTHVFGSDLAPVEAHYLAQQIPWYLKKGNRLEIFRNNFFLPRARFATNVVPVKDVADAAHLIEKSRSLDFQSDAVAETNDRSPQHLEEGIVLDADYHPRLIQLKVRTYGRGFLVLADQYYKGWHATIDGTEVPIQRTNAIMRGVFIETPGIHTIRFEFHSESLRDGVIISLVGLLLSVILFCGRSSACIFAAAAERRRRHAFEKPSV